MPAESYTLREVAEALGLSKRTLQRRIQEGAFPGRFLAAGRHGLETRVPAEDVERALADLKRRSPGSWRRAPEWDEDAPEPERSRRPAGARAEARRRPSTIMPARELDSLVPYESPDLVSTASSSEPSARTPSSLTHSDLDSLRDAMLAIVREDREMFLAATREALMVRDREILGLKQEIAALRRVMESVRAGVEGLEHRVTARRESEDRLDAQVWADVLNAPMALSAAGSVDVDALLREISELESMLVTADRD